MITNWRDLKIGQHIRLSCGCAGWVKAVYPEGPDPSSIGFIIAYTFDDCGQRRKRWGYRKTYSDGYGPYTNFFNHDLCEQALPLKEEDPPAWWKNFEAGPDRKLQELKRARWKKFQEKIKRGEA